MASIIVLETCNGCGRCVEVCPFSVYEISEGFAMPVRSEDCILCCSCVEECPQKAIVVVGCD